MKNRRFYFLLFLFAINFQLFSNTIHSVINMRTISSSSVSLYSGGDGSLSNPYQINSTEDLIYLSNHSSDWSAYFVQTHDVFFSPAPSLYDWNGDGVVSDANGFSPIGNSTTNFTGVYNGQGFKIYNLYVNTSIAGAGLFGYCNNAEVVNVGLINTTILGGEFTGALIGYCKVSCTVDACYSIVGTLQGTARVGGLIGYVGSDSELTNVFSIADVEGQYVIGGLVGMFEGENMSLTNAFAKGSVEGTYLVGGIAGSGPVSLASVYAVSSLTGAMSVDPLIGNGVGASATSSYWDMEISGILTASLGRGLSTQELKSGTSLLGTIWAANSLINGGYPYLSSNSCFSNSITEFVGIGDWTDSSLWTNGIPSQSGANEVIITGKCTLSTSVNVESVKICPSGKLIVDDTGLLEYSSGLICQASADGTAEFTSSQNSYTDVTIEMFFKSGQWNFATAHDTRSLGELFPGLSSASDYSDASGDYWAVRYSESDRSSHGTGMSDLLNGSSTIMNGDGFMVWLDEDFVSSSVFEIKCQDHMTLTSFSSSSIDESNEGWNLVGNPFACTINTTNFFQNSNNNSHFNNSIYVWDGAGYRVVSGGVGDEEAFKVAPNESFFVKRSSIGDYVYLNILCTYMSNDLYVNTKSASTNDVSTLTIALEANGTVAGDRTYIVVDENATEDFDNSDAYKFETSSSNRDLIYSSLSSVDYAINHTNLSYEEKEIPLVIQQQSQKSEMKLYFEISGESDIVYKLRDSQTGTERDILNRDTVIISTQGASAKLTQYSIVAKNTSIPTGVDESKLSLCEILDCSSVTGMLCLKNISDSPLVVDLFALDGKRLSSVKLDVDGLKNIEMGQGVFVIQAYSDFDNFSAKVFVK